MTAFTNAGFAASFAVSATDVAPSSILDGQRCSVLKIAVTNPAAGGPATVLLTTLGLRFEQASGLGLSTLAGSNLFATIEIFRDANGSGVFEPAADTFVSALFSPDFAADGSVSFDFADADPAERQVASGATASYFVLVQLTPGASLSNPNAFRLTHRANGPGSTTATDANGVPLTLTASPDVTSKIITAALNQPPTTTGIANIVVFDNAAASTIPLFSAFHDPEDASNAMSYSVVGNNNPTLFQFVGIEPATGNLLLTYATGATGAAQLTVKAMDTLGKAVSTTFQVKVVPFVTFSDFLSLHPGAGGPLESGLGNGQVNLLSYAFFLNQGLNGGIAGLPRLQGTGNSHVFTHLRPKFASDVFYNYQLSQDMSTWVPALKNVDYYENTKDLGDGSIRVELLLLGTWSKVFMRAQAQLVGAPPQPTAPPPAAPGSSTNPAPEPGDALPPPPPPGAGNPIQSSVMFPAQTILGNQSYATSICVVDINGDGYKDVVCAALTDVASPVAWYKNLGNGTFGPKQVITTLVSGASAVRAADLDGDNLVDVVSASEQDGKVAWYKQYRNPVTDERTFGPQQVLTNLGQFPTSLDIADFNRDGRPDVVWNSWLGSKISWCPNTTASVGNGSFGAPQLITTQSANPYAIAAADLDGDLSPDLIAGSVNDHAIAWYRGNGTGGFGSKQVLANNVNAPNNVDAADLDGDGKLDVIAALTQDNKVIWFRNTGTTSNATFAAPQVIATQISGPYSAHPCDLNGDGWIDIVSASVSDGKVAWYRNLGNGNFGNPAQNQMLISNNNSAGANSVSTADFDHDGMIDVASASQDDAKVAIYLNRGGQTEMTTTDVAPASILDGQRQEMLRIAVTSRGQAGENYARLATLSLLLESTAGVALTTTQANALIENLYVYADADNSGFFEPSIDLPVAVVTYLSLNAGRLTVPVRDNSPAVQIAPGSTRNFFVVPQMAANAASQSPNTLRIIHFSAGPGRSTARDAFSSAVLTVESSAVVSVASSISTAQVNQAPTTTGLPGVTVYDTIAPTFIALPSYFNDAEDGAAALRYTIIGNSNAALLAFVGLDHGSGVLTLRYRPGIGGTSSITVQAADSLGKTISATFQVSVLLADTFSHWSNANGGGTLLDYAFGSNGSSGGTVGGLPKLKIQGKARILSHLRPRWATDLSYQYEMSQDMTTWIPAIPGIHYHEFSKELPNAVRQSDCVLLTNWPRTFMRVRTTLSN